MCLVGSHPAFEAVPISALRRCHGRWARASRSRAGDGVIQRRAAVALPFGALTLLLGLVLARGGVVPCLLRRSGTRASRTLAGRRLPACRLATALRACTALRTRPP